MQIPNEVRTVVESGRLAHLTTLNPDGSPQMSLVWVGIEDGEIVTAHLGEWQKVRNVRRDPRVALTIEAEGTSGGLDNYLLVHGTARVTDGGAPELLQELARRYVGPDAEYPRRDRRLVSSPASGLTGSAASAPGWTESSPLHSAGHH